MPEGPECKIIGEYLHNKLENVNCVGMIFHKNSRYSKHSLPKRFTELTYPFKIRSVNVKGKLIWFEFDNGFIYVKHVRYVWDVDSKTSKTL